jgi:hypothetical protein
VHGGAKYAWQEKMGIVGKLWRWPRHSATGFPSNAFGTPTVLILIMHVTLLLTPNGRSHLCKWDAAGTLPFLCLVPIVRLIKRLTTNAQR